MTASRYRFRTVWHLPRSAPGTVLAALERVDAYPRWWPQVREVRRIDDRTGTARFRSRLPFELRVTLHEVCRDPSAGLLEGRMTGDLHGWTRWRVLPDGHGGSRAVHEQDVEVRKPLLRLLSPLARPLFRANHAVMMRAGERGLRRLLGRGFG